MLGPISALLAVALIYASFMAVLWEHRSGRGHGTYMTLQDRLDARAAARAYRHVVVMLLTLLGIAAVLAFLPTGG